MSLAEPRRLDWRSFRWPGGRPVAIALGIACEGWSDGCAPVPGPMGPPPPGAEDVVGAAWARYGPRRGIWRLLDILERHEARATVFASGIVAERHPEPIRAATEAGHDVAAHSWAQDIVPAALEEEQEREHLVRTVEAIERACGERPRGWASPGGRDSAGTLGLLAASGFEYHFGNFDDDLPFIQRAGGRELVAIPFNADVNDLPASLRFGNLPHDILRGFEETTAWLLANDEVAVVPVTFHAHIYGRPHGAWVLERIVEFARHNPGVWLTSHRELADHCLRAGGPSADRADSRESG